MRSSSHRAPVRSVFRFHPRHACIAHSDLRRSLPMGASATSHCTVLSFRHAREHATWCARGRELAPVTLVACCEHVSCSLVDFEPKIREGLSLILACSSRSLWPSSPTMLMQIDTKESNACRLTCCQEIGTIEASMSLLRGVAIAARAPAWLPNASMLRANHTYTRLREALSFTVGEAIVSHSTRGLMHTLPDMTVRGIADFLAPLLHLQSWRSSASIGDWARKALLGRVWAGCATESTAFDAFLMVLSAFPDPCAKSATIYKRLVSRLADVLEDFARVTRKRVPETSFVAEDYNWTETEAGTQSRARRGRG